MRQFEQIIGQDKQPRITPVNGGHMSYERLLIQTGDEVRFAKVHDVARFTDPIRERHSREYLIKEHAMMAHLRERNFSHIPAHSRLIGDHSLVMEGLSPDDGWHWRAPQDNLDQYVHDVTSALTALQETDHPADFLDSHGPAHDAFIAEGWQSLDTDRLRRIHQNIQNLYTRMQPRLQSAAVRLLGSLQVISENQPNTSEPSNLCHHDLRQANVAWHPEHGARIVDWSWAGVGLAKADHTSLLIDLHKSGHDVSNYLDVHFNHQHAHLLLGFLLARSVASARDEQSVVRFHQTVSAISTFDLLDAQENI